MAKGSSIRVTGDAQAEAVAHIAGLIPQISQRYDVAYEEAVPRGTNTFTANGKTFTFPILRLEMLWPLTCANERNAPEPGLPHGRFPYGDKFVAACRAKSVPADHILGICTMGTWDPNWPDLEEAFRIENRRLAAADAACDVKIGAFILKRFRAERLFWTVDHPSDVLLAELTKRLLSAAALIDGPDVVDGAFSPATSEGILGIYAVPVHPHVAKHFALAWYRPDQTYQAFDRSYTYETYYAAFVAATG